MSLDNDYNDSNNDDKPKMPHAEDCCGSGCTPCVFDVYKILLKEWESKEIQNMKVKMSNNLLSPLSYKTFIIIDISEISKGYFLLHLEYPEHKMKKDARLHLIPGQHVILHARYKSRPYTPISWTTKDLILLVKLYKQGELSTYLKDAPIGSTIEIRGPYGDFKYESNSIGSGIAALYPIAKAIVDDETELTRVYLVAGFQSVAHVPLKKELRHLVDFWNFKCTLQLSQLNDKTINFHGFNIKAGRLSKSLVANYLQSNSTETTLILICGTSEFNQYMREWLQEMNYKHVHIFE